MCYLQTYGILSFVFICTWTLASLTSPLIGNINDKERIVNIGIILDNADIQTNTIDKSIEIAMKVTNGTRSAKMNRIRNVTDFRDSFKVIQTLCSMTERQPLAFFATSQRDALRIFESFGRSFRIPFFVPTQSHGMNTDDDSYIVNMFPSFIEAVIDIIKFFRWEKIYYLYDSSYALWRLQKLYEAFDNYLIPDENKKLLVKVVRIRDVKNCRDMIWKLDRENRYDGRNYIVDFQSLQSYNMFMKQIVQIGMNKDGYNYLLGTLDINGMNKTIWKSFIHGGANVTGLQLVKTNHRHSIFTLQFPDNREPSVEEVLTVDSVAVLTTAVMHLMRKDIINFRRGKLYLEMNCSTNPIKRMDKGRLVMEEILNVTLEGSNEGLSGRVAFDAFGNRKGYSLDVYHLSYRSPFKEVAQWKDGIGLQDMQLAPPTRVGEPPLNATMIVTTILLDPFVQLKKEENGSNLIGNDKYEGYCIDMMKLLAKRINLTYTIKLVDDGEFGSKPDVNSSWNGLIGELLTKKADIALASLTITRKREAAVYFTKPFMTTGISLMIKKPEKERPGVFSFMQPLSSEVWGCIMCGFFAVSFILYMVGRFSPFEWRNGDNGEKGPSDTFSFANNIWYNLGAILQQGPDEFPRSLSGRILASAWWFFTLITVSSYTANLAACLTFERLVTPINSVDDLVKQSKIKYGTQESGSTFDFFKDSNVSVYKTMYNVMRETTPSVYEHNAEKGWERVINERGKYAFLLESSSNNYFNQRKPCKTMKVGRNLDQKGYGIATRKTSPLGDILNIALLEIREKGDLLKLEQKWWYQKGQCGGSGGGGKGKPGLNLSNVSGIFHILIGGLVLAIFISLTQLACHTCLKSHAKKKSYKINNAIKILEEEPLSGNRNTRPVEQRYHTF